MDGSIRTAEERSVENIAGKEVRAIRQRIVYVICGVLLLAGSRGSRAQDVEPRLLSPAPVGTNIVGLTLGHSWGAILLDKTLPVEDLDGSTYSLVPSFTRFINFFGLSSHVTVAVPFATGEWDALVGEDPEPVTVSRSGLGDSMVGMTVFLAGARAMTPAEFRDYRRKTLFGAFVRLRLPTGQYDPENLINLGSNRWHLGTGLGAAQWWGKVAIEAYALVLVFTDNKELLGDSVLSQDPLAAFQLHLTYSFKSRLWLALGARRTTFGKTTLNGVERDDPSDNSRMGLVLGFPVGRGFTAKLVATTGVRASTGNDFNTVNLQLFYSW